ncbi:Polygalacturonase inhibitor 2 [Platanthera zijinensis]|uniref:Polygalacturonase inhibitor 2 n=1 Tax=Platanthera zijinensis TaxID=2320716 RepID=A0AAP0BDC9_9ASPA
MALHHKAFALFSGFPDFRTGMKNCREEQIMVLPVELMKLLLLEKLYLDNDKLAQLPPELGELRSLKVLRVDNNLLLSGDIPTELWVPDWVNLDLSHNKLCGDASFLFCADKPTNLINLSFNNFEFDMSMIKFSVSTWTLVVNNNMINGSIPAQINMLSNPVNFNMSYNRLCGIIPAGPVMDKFDGAHFYHNKCLCRSKDSCL